MHGLQCTSVPDERIKALASRYVYEHYFGWCATVQGAQPGAGIGEPGVPKLI